MKFNKKASLQLSINAIVILVMAMVVLGLGLAFIRGMFEQGGGKLLKAIDNADLENPADSQNPLTIDNVVKVKKDSEAQFSVGFYNSAGTDEFKVFLTGCSPEHSTDETWALSVASISANVPSNGATGFKALIVAKGVPEGTYSCNLGIKRQEGVCWNSDASCATGDVADSNEIQGQFTVVVSN